MYVEDLFEDCELENSHSIWNRIKESSDPEKRELCNSLYEKFAPFADKDFKNKFRVEFFSAFWEMDLACTLIRSGKNLSVKDSGDRGPDICVLDLEGRRTWIEAICVTRGTTRDEISLGRAGEVTRIDSEKILLRLTSAIYDKDIKHKEYLEQGVCKEDEPFVIAINGCHLTPGPGLDDLTPRIVKAVFEGGDDELLIDRIDGKYLGRQLGHRPVIPKHNNEKIPTGYFRLENYSNISAIIYSESGFAAIPAELGSDYVVVHNPISHNPLSEGYFRFGTEYMDKFAPTEISSLRTISYRQLDYLYV
jgi:hypothetical protein